MSSGGDPTEGIPSKKIDEEQARLNNNYEDLTTLLKEFEKEKPKPKPKKKSCNCGCQDNKKEGKSFYGYSSAICWNCERVGSKSWR